MVHRLPHPLGRRISLYITLFILLVFLSHCQKRDETPPPPKVAELFLWDADPPVLHPYKETTT